MSQAIPAPKDPEDLGHDRPIRDASTVVLLRRDAGKPRVLMGQRGAAAAFMPNKFVFPGGAIDADDARAPLAQPMAAQMESQLSLQPVTIAAPTPQAMVGAAVRELWEEAGLLLTAPGDWEVEPAPDWAAIAERGQRPDPSALRFIFRAVTPPGRSRRFDARFFLADAEKLQSDPDDFALACDELSHLHWIDLDEARGLDLPFITEVVLAEVAQILRGENAGGVPFFDNSGPRSTFRRLV